MAMAAPSLSFSLSFNPNVNPKSQLFPATNNNPFSLKLRRNNASELRRRKIYAGGFFLVSEAIPVENSREIVVGSDDGVAGVIVSTLLFIAFVGLSILTVGAIYIAVTDFLQKREEEKFKKEEAAAAKKMTKKKNKKGPIFRGDRPRGFGQKNVVVEEEEEDAN